MGETTTEETPKKRGRKADPVTPLLQAYRKANAKADRARAAREKAREAEAEERAAYDALQDAIADIPAPDEGEE